MRKREKPGATQFTIRMRCVVEKVVTVEGCTEEQARANPWDYAVDEREDCQVDWKVLSVKADSRTAIGE